MSASGEFVEFADQKAARLPEKSSIFTQTCSRLSQYLKENGSLGDLNLGITCSNEPNGIGNGVPEMLRQTGKTMNLFPMIEKSGDVSNMGTSQNFRSMDLFPQRAPTAPKEDVQKGLDSSVNKSATADPETAQMTIFYAGQVIVFNDFPADKAKEVMFLAGKTSSQSHTAFPSNPVKTHTAAFATSLAKTPVESGGSIPPSPIPPRQPISSDLPIARRASLHRFLEKRKDRIISRAPYQSNCPMMAPSKAAETKSWLGLAAQSPQ